MEGPNVTQGRLRITWKQNTSEESPGVETKNDGAQNVFQANKQQPRWAGSCPLVMQKHNKFGTSGMMVSSC